MKLRGLGEVLLGDISAVMVICDAAGKSEHEQRIEGHSVAARMSAGRVQGESRDKDMRTLQELRKAKRLTAYQLDEAAGTGKGFTTRLECGVTNLLFSVPDYFTMVNLVFTLSFCKAS